MSHHTSGVILRESGASSLRFPLDRPLARAMTPDFGRESALGTAPLQQRRNPTISSRVTSRSFRVGRSPTGLGLFATQQIDKGAFIVAYRGRRIPTPRAQAIERASGAKYMFEIDARWTIDGASRRNLARYVNHSCRPNAEAVLRKGRLAFIARRAIKPGDEITLDYGRDYLELFIPACRCAACNARGEVRRSPRRKRRRQSQP
jgi:hypothetical protein